VVKRLWGYIREKGLQNPRDRREIVLDGAMRRVFAGCERFTMFEMNKHLSAHIHPFKKPADAPSPAPSAGGSKRRRGAASAASSPKPRGSAKRAKRGGGASPGSAKKSKKPRKAGSQPPYRLSEELQDVVGTDVLPRPQVVSKIWEYIKLHGLQNPKDKREILCDDRLRKVFQNRSRVTMFSMNQHLTRHLLEKADRSEYTASASAAAASSSASGRASEEDDDDDDNEPQDSDEGGSE
jgi:upstream activation factor subunit UAF30